MNVIKLHYSTIYGRVFPTTHDKYYKSGLRVRHIFPFTLTSGNVLNEKHKVGNVVTG